MKVFMSWSGARSRATAQLLHDWIKCVIQGSKPWISTSGLGRGSVWFTGINNELRDTSVGIICLTRENLNAPWILFEAGALAKDYPVAKVCTFLVDLTPNDVRDPLAQFNHTLPDKEGLRSLVVTLNSSLEQKLDAQTLEAVFETFWPDFERQFQKILNENPETTPLPVVDEKDMIGEILQLSRRLDKRLRMLEAPGVTTITRESSLKGDKRATTHFWPNRSKVAALKDYENLLELRDMALKGAPYDGLVEMARHLGFTADELEKFVQDPTSLPPHYIQAD